MHPAVGAGVDEVGPSMPAAALAPDRGAERRGGVGHPRKSTSDGWIARESAPSVAL
jgi:hypothetical protein